MGKSDIRKLPNSVLMEKRCQAVKLRQKGMIRAEIEVTLGVHPDTVGRWLKTYRTQGANALNMPHSRCIR